MNNYERDLLVRIDERVEAIHARLSVGDTRLNDHTKRISLLERWRAAVVGGLTLLGAFVAWKLI